MQKVIQTMADVMKKRNLWWKKYYVIRFNLWSWFFFPVFFLGGLDVKHYVFLYVQQDWCMCIWVYFGKARVTMIYCLHLLRQSKTKVFQSLYFIFSNHVMILAPPSKSPSSSNYVGILCILRWQINQREPNFRHGTLLL